MAVTTKNGWIFAARELDEAITGAVAPATTTVNGTVKKAATQSNFAGADNAALLVELNAFLAKLKAAGIVA